MIEIKRDAYLQQLTMRKDNGMIKVITGIRRCGKSFLLFNIFKRYLQENGVDTDHIIEIALDGIENEERQMVSQSIHKAFNEYIDALKKHTKLTQDEAVLCCLVKCGLNTKECAVCKGVSLNAIRTQKSRIKSKLM